MLNDAMHMADGNDTESTTGGTEEEGGVHWVSLLALHVWVFEVCLNLETEDYLLDGVPGTSRALCLASKFSIYHHIELESS